MLDLPFVIEDDPKQVAWSATPTDGARRFRKHYASGRYTRPKTSSRVGGEHESLLTLPICAVDGEGVTADDGMHHYINLNASWLPLHAADLGRASVRAPSLTTEQCFDFLLSLPEHHTYVGYGLSYDTNMWCRMLPHKVINLLLDKGKAMYKHYRLQWVERKFFRISRAGRSFTVYDVLPNWQVSFVKALEAWNVGTPEERELVAQMKEQRGNFNAVDQSLIDEYCYLECDLLRVLCRKLFDAILETPYRPRAVYGPGALAAAALEKHRIKTYNANLPEPVNTLTRHAYFGGRFDCSMFGWFSDIYQYDIKSAYPHHIRYLPCLAHAQWTHEDIGFERIIPHKWGMYHVEWQVPDESPWPPFPHRTHNGNVFYPYVGSGWYHAAEVTAALAMYGSDCINVTEAWHLESTCDHAPFSFVDSLYALRKKLESEGGYDQGVVIKLILNSLYGKLAQQVGGSKRNNYKPPFQCFYWAGAITAGTRAMILNALAANADDVIGIATDSLVSMRELDFLPLGGELGEWDYKHLSEYMQISNGVYHGMYDWPEKERGKMAERARGLGRFVLNWDDVKRDFVRTRGAGIHEFAGRSRFITLREARQRLDSDAVACRWVGPGTPTPQTVRHVDFRPRRRIPMSFNAKLVRTTLEPYAPEDYGAERESQPFKLKHTWHEVTEDRERHHQFAWSDLE